MSQLLHLATAVAWWTAVGSVLFAGACVLAPLSDRLLSSPEESASAQLATARRAAHRSVHCHEHQES